MICPKCGFEQPESLDCARCGIVFSRYKGAPAPGARPQAPPPSPAAPVPPPPAFTAPPPPSWPPAPATGAFPGAPPPSWPPAPAAEAFPAFAPPPPPSWPPTPAPAAGPFAGPPPPPPPASPFSGGTLYGEPHGTPSAAVGGTLYEGPPAAGGGTLYEGPPAAAPATTYGGPAKPSAVASHVVRPGVFTVGKVLSQTFSIYFRNVIPFLIISVVVVLPIFSLLYFPFNAFFSAMVAQNPNAAQLGNLAGGIALLFAALLASPFATAAFTYGVFQEMRKREGTVVQCLSVGLSSLFAVAGVALLQGLAVGLGTLACIIPGIILRVMYSVAVPAAVEERPGVIEALRRSGELTAGYRGEVFGVLLVLGLLERGIATVIEAMFRDTMATAGGNYLATIGAAQLFLTGLSATAAAVMYYQLRSVKESIDVEDLVSVFD